MWAGIWFVATTELESDLPAIVDWVRKWPIAVKKHILFFYQVLFSNSGANDVKIDRFVLELFENFKKLLVCWDCLFLQYWIEILILTTLLKIIPKNQNLILSVTFLSSEVATYLYQTTWNTVFIFGLVLLPASWVSEISYRNKYLGPSLAVSLELTELVPLPHSNGRSTRYSNRLRDFSVTIPGC